MNNTEKIVERKNNILTLRQGKYFYFGKMINGRLKRISCYGSNAYNFFDRGVGFLQNLNKSGAWNKYILSYNRLYKVPGNKKNINFYITELLQNNEKSNKEKS